MIATLVRFIGPPPELPLASAVSQSQSGRVTCNKFSAVYTLPSHVSRDVSFDC